MPKRKNREITEMPKRKNREITEMPRIEMTKQKDRDNKEITEMPNTEIKATKDSRRCLHRSRPLGIPFRPQSCCDNNEEKHYPS